MKTFKPLLSDVKRKETSNLLKLSVKKYDSAIKSEQISHNTRSIQSIDSREESVKSVKNDLEETYLHNIKPYTMSGIVSIIVSFLSNQ